MGLHRNLILPSANGEVFIETRDVIIVGAGIMGIATAIELRNRGYAVSVFDQGEIPHPQAASTDISKALRLEYGDDAAYTHLANEARDAWLQWNAMLGETVYHETGMLFLTRKPLASGQYEFDSLKHVRALGCSPEIIDPNTIAKRYPAWNSQAYTGAVFNPVGGYLRSGRIIELFTSYARQQGVKIYQNQPVARLLNQPLTGVVLEDGTEHQAGCVIVATGAWSVTFLPELAGMLKSIGLPVFHVAPDKKENYDADVFPLFGADVSNTGWYGFPLHPNAQVIKIARHSTGRAIDPVNDPREVSEKETQDFRAFLRESLPSLADQSIVYTRLCLYSDSFDGDFIIDQDPEKPGVVVATGGSGHAFKFGSILGNLVSDCVESVPNKHLQRFRWRSPSSSANGHTESARFLGE